MLRKLISLITGSKRRCFVIADAKDNSITLSKQLCKVIGVFNLEENKILVFRLANTGSEKPCYAFALNPHLKEETQLCEIQYNAKHKCVGFETLCPTVNRIFYDYNLPADSVCKLTVVKETTSTGFDYYKICNPYE